MTLAERNLDTPVGRLRVVAKAESVVGVYWPDHEPPPLYRGVDVGSHPVLDRAIEELSDYFAGHRRLFTIPFALEGTPFQRRVWDALVEVGYGETRSYSEVAQAIGQPGAARAVGTACGRNPLSIVVPCHRIVGSGGGLGGYAGGIDLKRSLLEHERTRASEARRAATPPTAIGPAR